MCELIYDKCMKTLKQILSIPLNENLYFLIFIVSCKSIEED